MLTYIGKGLTIKETADRMFVSYKTVENHLGSIKCKLDLQSINALTAFAISAGMY